MTKQEIEVTVDKQGNVSIEVIGGEGPSCMEETKDLEDKLGIVESREKKPEYYKEAGTTTKTELKSG